MTITVSEETARWARRKAAEENTSISRLVGAMLERQRLLTDEYRQAYADWKRLRPQRGAAAPWSRDETHARRR
jgi:hypothetical protein